MKLTKLGERVSPPDPSDGTSIGSEMSAGFSVLYRYIHCNSTGTYRVYGSDTTIYQDLYMVQGAVYEGSYSKITTISDADVTDGYLAVMR